MKKNQKSILKTIHKVFRNNSWMFIGIILLFFILITYLIVNFFVISQDNFEKQQAVKQLAVINLEEQLSVFQLCLADTDEKFDEYSILSNQYDMELQTQIALVKKLLPEESDTMLEIQTLLQDALESRRIAVLSSTTADDSQSALLRLEEDYLPQMKVISEICNDLSQRVNEDGNKQLYQLAMIAGILMGVMILIVVFMIIILHKNEKKVEKLLKKPIQEITEAMNEMEKGNLEYQLNYLSEDEMGDLANGIRNMLNILKGHINEIGIVLSELANKKYDITMEHNYTGDFIKIETAFSTIIQELNEIFKEIMQGNYEISNTGEEVKIIADCFVEGTMENAASIEELTALMQEIVSQVQNNLLKIEEIHEEEKDVAVSVNHCKNHVDTLLKVMKKTVKTSQELDKYMQHMDEISNQIRLLSLNASIEAAAAGHMGNGFGVLAEEIRKLSDQTGVITNKSKEFVKNCVDELVEGQNVLFQTGESMEIVNNDFFRIKNKVQDVYHVSKTELLEIQRFEEGIASISQVIQKDSIQAMHLSERVEEMKYSMNKMQSKMEEFQIR